MIYLQIEIPKNGIVLFVRRFFYFHEFIVKFFSRKKYFLVDRLFLPNQFIWQINQPKVFSKLQNKQTISVDPTTHNRLNLFDPNTFSPFGILTDKEIKPVS